MNHTKSIHSYKIINKAGVLHIETGPPPVSIPIFPKSNGNEPMEFQYITPYAINMPVTFRFDEEDRTHFIVERNSLHKVD